MPPPAYFPLRWESTGDQWWYASPIDWAAANGHYDLVRELLRLDGNHLITLTSLRRIRRLETVWDDEEQFHDVSRCRSEVAKKLFLECGNKKGRNSLIRAGYGGWLLYTAASAGDLAFVRDLLEKDPLLVFGEGEYGVTDILYAAARSKNADVFRVLFDFAISPRFMAANGRELEEHIGEIPSAYKGEMMNRAIHAAARGGNLDILKELLSDCSDDVLAYRDIKGSTILHTAAGRGQVEVVEYIAKSFDSINSTDSNGNTALHVAAYRGQLAVVKALIIASPSLISCMNNSGETFLHLAVTGFHMPGFRRLDFQIKLMEQLVSERNFNIKEIINAKNIDGRTALQLAIVGNIHSDLVKLLMTVPSIDVNIRDENGMTPLDILRLRPRSASSETLTRQLISVGGIFSHQDYSARRVIASHLKMQGTGSSPGTSFRISDTEIFLHTGIEIASDENGFAAHSTEISPPQSSMGNHSPRDSTKLSSTNYAQRLKRLLHWPRTKEQRTERLKKLVDKTKSLEVTPIPLRQRFSKPSSLHSNKRTLAVRSELSSPTAKKKFASGLVHGVMQAIPHIGVPRRSRSSSFSRTSLSSHNSLDNLGGASSSTDHQVVKDEVQGSTSKGLINQYLCFGGTGQPIRAPPSPSFEVYQRSVLSMS